MTVTMNAIPPDPTDTPTVIALMVDEPVSDERKFCIWHAYY